MLPSLDMLRSIPPREVAAYAEVDWVPLAAALTLFVVQVALSVIRSRRARL